MAEDRTNNVASGTLVLADGENQENLFRVRRTKLLVISGPLSLATSSQLNGFIYLQAQENELCFASQSRIQGAVVVSGDLKVTGAGGRIVYDKALLQRLQQAIENFRWVRVPGSWRDW